MKWISKIRSNMNKIQRRYMMREVMFERDPVYNSCDPIRHATVALVLRRLNEENVPGDMAEVGVYKGEMSRFIRQNESRRTFYLFDTFEGFPSVDLKKNSVDKRFSDTSLEMVRKKVGDAGNTIFRKGYFPDSAKGLEKLKFAFVMLDVDLYNPTLGGLEFFYPRISKGGCIMIHDYNSGESEYAVKKAVQEFRGKQELRITDIPDIGGSVLIKF